MHPTSARRSLSARLILAAVVAACSSGPTALPPNAPSGNSLYVANSSCPSCGAPASVTIYPAGATGNATPTATIAGSSTGLSAPTGIAVDPAGRLYVTNIMGNNNSITVYAVGATGNAAPSAAITGSNTSLRNPDGIAVDAAGQLYVTDANGPSITVYSAGATGNATPVATIAGSNTGLTSPAGIAVDAAGRLYVTNLAGNGISVNSITVYAASATGNATPTATIAGSNTELSAPAFMVAHRARLSEGVVRQLCTPTLLQ